MELRAIRSFQEKNHSSNREGDDTIHSLPFHGILVVDIWSAYHGVLGQPALMELWAIISIHHLYMKFSTENGIAIVRGDQWSAMECYSNFLRKVELRDVNVILMDIDASDDPE